MGNAVLEPFPQGPRLRYNNGAHPRCRLNSDCERLPIARQAAVGPCDAPLTPLRLFEDMDRPAQLVDLAARFAPFAADTPAGAIDFKGRGSEEPSLPWQRAIGQWARLVQLELRMGRSGASWGVALAWHEELLGKPGYCQFLQVEMYGYAFASVARCEGGDPQSEGCGWLESPEIEQLDAWLYGKERLFTDSVNFNGQGEDPFTAAEVSELENWAERLYSRLAGS